MAASLIVGPTDVVEQSWLKAPEPRAEMALIAAHLKLQELPIADRYRFHMAAFGLIGAAIKQFSGKQMEAETMSANERRIVIRILCALWLGDPDGTLDARFKKFESAAAKYTAKNGA